MTCAVLATASLRQAEPEDLSGACSDELQEVAKKARAAMVRVTVAYWVAAEFSRKSML